MKKIKEEYNRYEITKADLEKAFKLKKVLNMSLSFDDETLTVMVKK